MLKPGHLSRLCLLIPSTARICDVLLCTHWANSCGANKHSSRNRSNQYVLEERGEREKKARGVKTFGNDIIGSIFK